MGMVLELRRCGRAELAKIEAASEEDVYDTAFPGDLMEALYENGKCIDLDKMWHAIHFLLTGVPFTDALPEGFIFGGIEVSEEQGYGPIRMLRPEAVHEIAELLRPLKREAFLQRFDAKVLTQQDIYPGIWETGHSLEDTEIKDDLGEQYEILRRFMLDASGNSEGVVLSLS